MGIVDTAKRSVPPWVKGLVPASLRRHQMIEDHARSLPSYPFFQGLMSRYRVENLVGVDSETFKRRIDEFLALDDYRMEGFANPERQRDLSIRFYWGHDHDFGGFALQGRMRSRHLALLTIFRDRFGAIPQSLEGLRVLDIGAWTGGVSLVLAAMGAQVTAVEEVKKYVEALTYLKQAFAIDNLDPRHLSLYECTLSEFQDAFDLVIYAGVLYHVTDPTVSLRITFNCLRDGGRCLVETAAVNSEKPILAYHGPGLARGDRSARNRSGWNWYFPSLAALARMMEDVGFAQVQVSKVIAGRAFAVGRRDSHVDIMRGGLSVPGLR
jgi:2-polyprenyl-3-methyl-5-hydroxy-6-metoxy-1,4-benzoquinol methylase